MDTSFVLVSKLLVRGNKKIALFTPDTHITAVTLRKEGYKKALKEANIPYDENLYCEVKRNNYEEDVIKVLDILFEKVPEVDGFFFTTHYLALETILYFFRKNINIDQFGLACIHRNPLFATLAPNMYVAAIPLDEMGHTAVNILLNDMNNKNEKGEKTSCQISLSPSL